MFDLTGKSALVTGASGGIGADIARVLHAAGATVGLSGTRVEPLAAPAAGAGGRRRGLPSAPLGPPAGAGPGLPRGAPASSSGRAARSSGST